MSKKIKMIYFVLFIITVSMLLFTGCQERDYRIQETIVETTPLPYNERPTVAVMPFRNLSGNQRIKEEALGSTLLRTRLSNTDRFRIVPEEDVLSHISDGKKHNLSAGEAISIARKTNSRYAVTGVIENVKIETSPGRTEVELRTKIQVIDTRTEKVKHSYSPTTTASDSSTGDNIEKLLLWTVKQEMINKTVNFLVSTL